MSDHLPVHGSIDNLLLNVFRDYFAGKPVQVLSQYTGQTNPPMVIGRLERRSGAISLKPSDDRFLKAGVIAVSAITSGPDADEDAEALQEACRLALLEAFMNQTSYPDCGHIARLKLASPSSRVNDYATSTSVVQYAALPADFVRTESIYHIVVAPPDQSTITNPFIKL